MSLLPGKPTAKLELAQHLGIIGRRSWAIPPSRRPADNLSGLFEDSLDLTGQGLLGSHREKSDPVLSAFFNAHDDLPLLEIDVF